MTTEKHNNLLRSVGYKGKVRALIVIPATLTAHSESPAVSG